jgi:hypothetical protein
MDFPKREKFSRIHPFHNAWETYILARTDQAGNKPVNPMKPEARVNHIRYLVPTSQISVYWCL